MTFRLQVKPDPVKYGTTKIKIKTNCRLGFISSFCWLEKMASSDSSFYDEAKVSHGNGSHVLPIPLYNNLREVTKRK